MKLLIAEYHLKVCINASAYSLCLFGGFGQPPKHGPKSARNHPKRHNAIERRLKKRKKIAVTRLRLGDAMFVRFFNRRSITQYLIADLVMWLEILCRKIESP